MSRDKVERYYDTFDEWARLETPEGRLEFARAMDLLTRYLKPQSRILDLGGGPGRYTIALARQGHRVTLADLSRVQLAAANDHIEEAGVAHQVEAVDHVDATDLSRYGEGAFDAVVAFGPFYHLAEEADRQAAAREIARVLVNAGRVFVAFMPRFAGVSGLFERCADFPGQVTAHNLQECFTEGTFHNAHAEGFQEGFFATVPYMRKLFADAGVASQKVISLRGLAYGHEAAVWKMEETNP